MHEPTGKGVRALPGRAQGVQHRDRRRHSWQRGNLLFLVIDVIVYITPPLSDSFFSSSLPFDISPRGGRGGESVLINVVEPTV